MEKIAITLKPREIIGKAVKNLRKMEIVPVVIHDHGKPSVLAMGSYQDVFRVCHSAGKNHSVAITVGDQHFNALVKTVEHEPHKNAIRHVVFGAVAANEKVSASVPVRVVYAEGNEASPAERAGLVVLNQLEVVEVESLSKDLPDFLTVDGEKLVNASDHLTVGDIVVPKGVIIKTDATHSVASVIEPSALAAAEAVAPTEAEVVEEKAEAEATA